MGQKSGGFPVVCLHGQSILIKGHYDTTLHSLELTRLNKSVIQMYVTS